MLNQKALVFVLYLILFKFHFAQYKSLITCLCVKVSPRKTFLQSKIRETSCDNQTKASNREPFQAFKHLAILTSWLGKTIFYIKKQGSQIFEKKIN
jgi:hypothetical protein